MPRRSLSTFLVRFLQDGYILRCLQEEAEVPVVCSADESALALAFKLEETKFGQVTYMRVYQGTVKKGEWLVNVNTGKKIKVPRLVRMHSDEMEDVTSVSAGDVVAMFGVDCSSMDSFTDGKSNLAMTSMFVPHPVMSLAVKPNDSGKMADKFGKALGRFTKEDPTLRIHTDPESKETLLSGMGELHLEVYIERMAREYDVQCTVGQPRVVSHSFRFRFLFLSMALISFAMPISFWHAHLWYFVR